MISEEQFLELPSCKKCRNKGTYHVRCRTLEQQDEYGIPAGEMVTVKCSTCRANRRRREEFLKNKQFEDPIRFYELSDYELPDETQKFDYARNRNSLDLVETIIKDIDGELVDKGGFLMIFGAMDSGKTILSHIIAREAYIQGAMCHRFSIPEMSVVLSHRIHGNTVRDGDEIVFDLNDHIDVDVLIVEQFELINNYFAAANIRRSLIYNIFSGRLKAGKPTIVISKEKIADLFSEEEVKRLGIPSDFPSIFNKCYRTLNLHGRFKKEDKLRDR